MGNCFLTVTNGDSGLASCPVSVLAWKVGDLNPSPPACKASALPDELTPHNIPELIISDPDCCHCFRQSSIEVTLGFDLQLPGNQTKCLRFDKTHFCVGYLTEAMNCFVVESKGLEPFTYALQRRCSTG